jgi:hypothetical protein
MRLSRRALALLLLFGTLAATAFADDVTTTAGKKINGKLTAVDDKGINFTTGAVQANIPNREIVVVDFGARPLAQPKESFGEIELTDGSSIRVAKFSIKGKKFEADPIAFTLPKDVSPPALDIPIRTVFSAMKKADEAKFRNDWKMMLGTRGKRDLYVIELETGLTYQQGTIQSGSADGKSIDFEPENGTKSEELSQRRAAGFVFYTPQPATIAPTICRVHDVFGNTLNATAITIGTDSSVLVTTVSGATVKYASTASIQKLDYQQGNLAYISDLNPQVDQPGIPPEEQKLNPAAPYLKDRSLSNDAIKLDNQAFQRGLCIAPDTILTYNLGGDYSQFKATAGIDENGANATSAAKLTIEGDGQVLFSGTLTRKDKPKGLVLTVKGVKTLKIIVEAETPLNGNYVTLADALVQK